MIQLNNTKHYWNRYAIYLLGTQLQKNQLNLLFLSIYVWDLCIVLVSVIWRNKCNINIYVMIMLMSQDSNLKCVHNNIYVLAQFNRLSWKRITRNFCTLFNNLFYENFPNKLFFSSLFLMIILFCV